MGVKLTSIVERKRLSFEDLAHKRIGVDFSNAAYQFLSSIKQRDGTPLTDSKGNVTSHLVGLFSRTSNLLSQGIKVCFVFDGKPPMLKGAVQEARWEKKVLAQDLYETAKEEGDEALMLKYSKQFSRLTKGMVEESKELIDALGLPYIQAPCEADAQLAFLCKKGEVWAGATSDFDMLLHGCPRMVTNLTLSQKRRLPNGSIVKTFPELIELEPTLKSLGVSQEQLVCMGVLVGTDYHPGVKGIGPKKALKLVREKKTPREIFKDTGIPYEEILRLFTDMEVEKKYDLTWKFVNAERVKKLLVDLHDFSEDRVDSTLSKITTKTKEKSQASLDLWAKRE